MQTKFNQDDIKSYSGIKIFEDLLVQYGGSGSQNDLKKRKEQHLRFFDEYFTDINLKTILVEKEYIDKDYLEDFSAYFVRCFENYPKTCTRLHFFDFDFKAGEMENFIINKVAEDKYHKGYLGFMVIKPIPHTIIGKTCLKTYKETNKPRFYPATRDYKVHLFGIEFTIKTLAYQEQDNILGACATSALWSAFQITGHLFNHAMPSPVTVTKFATKKQAGNSRSIPNKGLNANQMADCIRAIGLEPLFLKPQNDSDIKAMIYSYSKQMKIPIILGIDLWNKKTNKSEGLHAVTISGFRIDENIVNLSLESEKIKSIYAHDDQIGPFARMEFTTNPLKLTTSWKDDVYEEYDNIEAKPIMIILPLYHKIRITYDTILSRVSSLNDFLEATVKGPLLTWDIFLSKSVSLKEDIREDKSLDDTKKIYYLTQNLPRFVWRAIGYSSAEKIVELVFDATDVEHGKIFLFAIIYSANFAAVIEIIEQSNESKDRNPLVHSLLG